MLDGEPTTRYLARGSLGLLWLRVGLIIATLFCCIAPPEVTSALIASAASVDDDVALADQLDEAARASQWRHRDASPSLPGDVLALENENENENENEDENTSSDVEVVPSRDELVSQTSMRRLVRHKPYKAVATVSTGLGRGPPLA